LAGGWLAVIGDWVLVIGHQVSVIGDKVVIDAATPGTVFPITDHQYPIT
jgi:hypothetical protein